MSSDNTRHTKKANVTAVDPVVIQAPVSVSTKKNRIKMPGRVSVSTHKNGSTGQNP